MRRVNVHTYPVRYAANENPGALVVFTPDANGLVHPSGYGARPAIEWMTDHGREMAAYTRLWRNRSWASLTDGISGAVMRNRNGFRVEVTATLPSASRRQTGWADQASTLEEALQMLEAYIDRAHVWVRRGMASEVPVVLSTGLRCWLDSRHPGQAFRGLTTKPAVFLEADPGRGHRAVRNPSGPQVADAELVELREAMLAAHRTSQLPLPFAA